MIGPRPSAVDTGVSTAMAPKTIPKESRTAHKKTEQEGFEPSEPFGSMVFKTIAISHSATAPEAHFVRTRPRFYSNLPLDQGFFGKTPDFREDRGHQMLASAPFLDYK